MVENNGVPVIKDSGKQREFGTGAIRDFAEGKGRCDLLPLEEVAELLPSDTIKHLAQLSKEPTNVNHIYAALRSFADEIKLPLETLMIEASKQYEGGATVHNSKGKGWENVIVFDDSDGSFPSREDLSFDEFEEERRIHYVACTRARNRLIIGVMERLGRFLQECDFTKVTKLDDIEDDSKNNADILIEQESNPNEEISFFTDILDFPIDTTINFKQKGKAK